MTHILLTKTIKSYERFNKIVFEFMLDYCLRLDILHDFAQSSQIYGSHLTKYNQKISQPLNWPFQESI